MDDEIFLNEKIKVLAIFSVGLNGCKPIKFVRESGREIEIKEIGLGFPILKGRKSLHIFDVTDGQADYRLEFDSESLVWHLTREADHYEF